MLRIAHLVDDTTPGGVSRYLQFLAEDPGMAALARHEVVPVPRNAPTSRPVEADIVVSHLAIAWRGLPGLMALRARHAGQPLLHVEHSYSAGFVAHNVTARARFFTLLRCAYALFDRVIAVSEGQAAWLRQRRLVAETDLAVVSPCVDLAPFRALAAPQGPIRGIGAIGRFDRQKGFDLLIEAFRQVESPDLRLRLIGDGPERARLEQLAGGDRRIEFTGFASHVAEALSRCDAVAMPSRWEPYGLVALEARAARRPLLVSGADGLADHAQAGAIPVASLTVAAWRDALAGLARGDGPSGYGGDCAAEAETRQGWQRLLAGFEAPIVEGLAPADPRVLIPSVG